MARAEPSRSSRRIGAAGFILNSGYHGAIPSVAINVLWIGIGVLALDGIEDCLMLQVGKLPQLAQVRGAAFDGVDPGAGNHGVAQVLHDFTEADVAGGLGDEQMKTSIGFDATVVVVQ